MSEATTQAAAYDLIDRFLRNNLYDDDYAKYSDALEALSQPAPSPQPAVPVVSDERLLLEWDRVSHITEAGSRRLAFARAILALRPAVEPMTEWEIADIFERWDNTSGASMSDFVRMVEAHRGITAKAEDAHQPTKEAEKP